MSQRVRWIRCGFNHPNEPISSSMGVTVTFDGFRSPWAQPCPISFMSAPETLLVPLLLKAQTLSQLLFMDVWASQEWFSTDSLNVETGSFVDLKGPFLHFYISWAHFTVVVWLHADALSNGSGSFELIKVWNTPSLCQLSMTQCFPHAAPSTCTGDMAYIMFITRHHGID